MGELSKEEKKRMKKQMKNGELSGFAQQLHAGSSDGEPSMGKILIDGLLSPIGYLICFVVIVYFLFADSQQPMLQVQTFHTYGCQQMIDDLESNPISAKSKYENIGIKVIGGKVESIGHDGMVQVNPIEGLLHTSGIILKFRGEDIKYVERLAAGDRCVIWGRVVGVTDAPFPDYVMEVMNMSAVGGK